jgi:hypothetical protein
MTQEMDPMWDRRPVPDPTSLTTAALHREITALQNEIKVRFETNDGEIVRLNLQRLEEFGALKELLLSKIDGLAVLTNEKFEGTERQRIEQKNDTKAAVDAALTAQKEAVKEQTTASDRSIAKSETATGKQLEQQQETSATAIDGLRRSIDDLKERIQEVATIANGTVAQKVGAREDRSGLYLGIGSFVGLAIVLLTAVGLIAAHL